MIFLLSPAKHCLLAAGSELFDERAQNPSGLFSITSRHQSDRTTAQLAISATLPLRLALFEKGAYAFANVLGAERLTELAAEKVERLN